ncbi:MAG: threonylcarbamoyl-AMP synthase [Clostridiaceae bacterium]|nr:threonylcarbamoyl-AMP synthase [Clostridiaceae bacterium]
MKTEVLKIDIHNIDKEKINYAAETLKSGGLVAFPTETVYGLGANALQKEAIHKIYKAKGRPSDNPLIVHIADMASLDNLVIEKPSLWELLAHEFWPGPLTMIFKKSSMIPDEITAGLNTVAIRMPSHPIAIALIKASGLPIAAPSANSSGRSSPTLASHVYEDLNGKIDLIIDGGSTDVGLESTVLDITSTPPIILRPGGVTLEQLRSIKHDISLDPALISDSDSALVSHTSLILDNNIKGGSDTKKNFQSDFNNDFNNYFKDSLKDPSVDFIPKSPGLKYKHYSPKAPLIIVDGDPDKIVNKINELVREKKNVEKRIGILATEQTKGYYIDENINKNNNVIVMSLGDRNHPEEIASNLFRSFREMDEQKVDIIFSEGININGIGLAIMNRMKKAAGFNIIKA